MSKTVRDHGLLAGDSAVCPRSHRAVGVGPILSPVTSPITETPDCGDGTQLDRQASYITSLLSQTKDDVPPRFAEKRTTNTPRNTA
jgi:hypothetical protein